MTACALDPSGCLSGTITFDNLAEVRQAGEALIDSAEGESIVFDCSGLDETSSVAVALLVAWRRSAHAQGRAVVFRHTPRALRDIAAFSGLTGILALEA